MLTLALSYDIILNTAKGDYVNTSDIERLTHAEFFAPHAAAVEQRRKARSADVGKRCFRSYMDDGFWHVHAGRITTEALEDMARAEATRKEANYYNALVAGYRPDIRSSGLGVRVLTSWTVELLENQEFGPADNIEPFVEDDLLDVVAVDSSEGRHVIGFVMPEGIFEVGQARGESSKHVELWARADAKDSGYTHGLPAYRMMRYFDSYFTQITTAAGDFWRLQ